MTLFEQAKASVTPMQAARRYGYYVERGGMIRCPFHDDRSPSMKLYDDHYYCFGCQVSGDVIDFTAKVFCITQSEAAKKLAADFGIVPQQTSILTELKRLPTEEEKAKYCINALADCEAMLADWKKKYAPSSPEDEPHPKYTTALKLHDSVSFMLDEAMLGTPSDRRAVVDELMRDGNAEKMRAWIRKNKEVAYERI